MDEVNKKPVEILLERYAQSHKNPINELIHIMCIPLIMWTLLGLLWYLHPLLALAAILSVLIYYFQLSPKLGGGMVLVSLAMLGLLYMLPEKVILPLSLALFIISWVGQFIGHYIEGKKPSFLDDLRFLLIGPLFVLAFFYRKYHIDL